VLNLSAVGVGLLARDPLPPHARLEVCRLGAGEQTIHQASVVRCAAMGGRWYLGCSLDRRLEEAELRDWLLPSSTPGGA
jgi:hypothetical protein